MAEAQHCVTLLSGREIKFCFMNKICKKIGFFSVFSPMMGSSAVQRDKSEWGGEVSSSTTNSNSIAVPDD